MVVNDVHVWDERAKGVVIKLQRIQCVDCLASFQSTGGRNNASTCVLLPAPLVFPALLVAFPVLVAFGVAPVRELQVTRSITADVRTEPGKTERERDQEMRVANAGGWQGF